jgi:hypothetical protein
LIGGSVMYGHWSAEILVEVLELNIRSDDPSPILFHFGILL